MDETEKVFEFFFDDSQKSKSRETVLKVETIAHGYLNAVCFWLICTWMRRRFISDKASWDRKGEIENGDAILGDFDGAKAKNMEDSIRRVRENMAANPRSMISFPATLKAIGPDRVSILVASMNDDDGRDDHPGGGENQEHYWGQALKNISRGAQVRAGKKTVLPASGQSRMAVLA